MTSDENEKPPAVNATVPYVIKKGSLSTDAILCAQPMTALPPGFNLAPYTLDPETGRYVAVLFAEPCMTNDEKAVRYDLDHLGIESRAAEAVELVELRAEVKRLTHNFVQTERHTSIVEDLLAEAQAEIKRLKASVENLDTLYVSCNDALREADAELAAKDATIAQLRAELSQYLGDKS